MEDQPIKVSNATTSTPAGALAIAIGALVPLALSLTSIFFGGVGGFTESKASTGFVAYAGLLLVFVAGARFGRGLRANGAPGVTVTASAILAALTSIFLPAQVAAGVLAVAHAGHGAWDVWSADRAQLPAWYGRLRFQTTLAAVPLLVAGVFVLGTG